MKSPTTQLSDEAIASARKAFLSDVCKASYVDPATNPLIYNRIDINTRAVGPRLYSRFFDALESVFENSRKEGFALTGVHLVRAAADELRRRIEEKGFTGEIERRSDTFEKKMDMFVRSVGKRCAGRGLDEKIEFCGINLYTVVKPKLNDLGEVVIDGDGKPVMERIFDDFEVEVARRFGADPKTIEPRLFKESMAILWQYLRGMGGRGKFREEVRHIVGRLLKESNDSQEAYFLRHFRNDANRAAKEDAPNLDGSIEDKRVAGMVRGIGRKGKN